MCPIENLIEQYCSKILLRIMHDDDHPITSTLERNLRSNAIFKCYHTKLAKIESFSNSFLQKFLPYIRDGAANFYKTVSKVNANSKPKLQLATAHQTVQHLSREKPLIFCPYCGEANKRLVAHRRLSIRRISFQQNVRFVQK